MMGQFKQSKSFQTLFCRAIRHGHFRRSKSDSFNWQNSFRRTQQNRRDRKQSLQLPRRSRHKLHKPILPQHELSAPHGSPTATIIDQNSIQDLGIVAKCISNGGPIDRSMDIPEVVPKNIQN
jgi:hypothetical protein